MEQKKTLWIIIASGIFLLVVFLTALIIYSPSLRQPQVQQSRFDPSVGWVNVTPPADMLVQNPVQEFPPAPPTPFGNQPQKEAETDSDTSSEIRTDSLTVIAKNTSVYAEENTTIDLNALKAPSAPSIVAKNELTAEQISMNRAQEEKTQTRPVQSGDGYYAPSSAVSSTATTTQKQPTSAPTKAAAAASTPKQNTTAAAPKKTTAAKVTAEAQKTPDRFWIQAAAYTSKRNADDARTTLEENKIPNEVFTYTDSSGKTFYRVRVGPYVTKSEAQYWQTRIAMIDKFADTKSVIINSSMN